MAVALALVLALFGTASPAGAFSGERAFAHLAAQCELGPRNPGSPGHARCADYIQEVLTSSGGRVMRQPFTRYVPGLEAEVAMVNILARFGPERAGGLLLGAHWDTRPWADHDPDSLRRAEPILGANDGASGTGLLLALAESFRERPPACPVLLAFFDGEDLGRHQKDEEWLLGSRHFAANLTGPLPEMGLIVDMVASESMVLALEARSRQLFPSMASLCDQIAAELGIGAYEPAAMPSVLDDHIPLIEAGIPTLLLIDFRDPVWHTHQDVPSRCAVKSISDAGRLVERLVRGGYVR